jgi:hypothetical protein
LNGRLDGLQRRPGYVRGDRNVLPLPGFELRIFHPVSYPKAQNDAVGMNLSMLQFHIGRNVDVTE